MRTIFQELVKKSDKSWYRNLLLHRVASKKLTDQEYTTVIKNCMNTSHEVKKLLNEKYGIMCAKDYAEFLDIKVNEIVEDVMEGFLYMGLYQPSTNTITINKRVIEIVRKFISDQKIEDIVPSDTILETVLYHELFHAMEDRVKGIYTRSKMIKKTYFGLYTTYRGLDAASEVGAVHFSKIMCNIDFSPCIYEQILLLDADQSYEEKLKNFIQDNSHETIQQQKKRTVET